jgi:hypothetical protein
MANQRERLDARCVNQAKCLHTSMSFQLQSRRAMAIAVEPNWDGSRETVIF